MKEEYQLEDIIKVKEENFELYNQLMIEKAITDGLWEYIPIKNFSHKLIGECIEIKYNQLYNEEFDRYYRNKWLNAYNHLTEPTPKITKKNSLLYTREWILAAKELGIPIPNRKVCNRNSYSLGELIELSYYGKQINETIENDNIDQILKSSNKNRIKVKLKITKVTRKKMKYYEE